MLCYAHCLELHYIRKRSDATKYMQRQFIYTILMILAVSAMRAYASDIDELLKYDERPAGVVIEIVSGDPDLLEELLPEVQDAIQRLHKQYPGLPIAIVSHGQELFLLTRENQSNAPEVHSIVKQLTSDNNVDVHVCGTYAGWKGVSETAFPDYVDVTHAGPAQINNYEELDYELITLP